MQSRDQQYRWLGDQATVEWLGARDKVAVFVFSEVPSWLGALGEVTARSLDCGTGQVEMHLWTRATPYQGDSGIPQAPWVSVESALMRVLGVAGGGRALAARLAELAPGRVTSEEPTEVLAPEPQARADMLSDSADLPLRDVHYKASAAGWAVYGNLSNLTMSSYATDLVSDDDTRLMLESYAAVYDHAVETLSRTRPDAVVLFNGRWLHEWAAREAAEQVGVPIVVVEAGRDERHFSTHSQSAHDEDQFAHRFRFTWETQAGLPEAEANEIAHRWFTSRRTAPTSANPFVALQVAGEVPTPVEGRRRIVYYTSSADELLAAGRSWLSPFGSQEEILERLVALAERDGSVQLVIRIHPHTLMKNSMDQHLWSRFQETAGRHVVVIPPDSTIDSYALAESSDLVLSIGSTMGIEAAYWGVPSATLGPALYDSLGVATVIHEFDDAFDVRVDDEERALRRERALAWGLHEAVLGTEFRYYCPERPLYRFAGAPLARRGALQSFVPEGLSRRRGRAALTRMRSQWDAGYRSGSGEGLKSD